MVLSFLSVVRGFFRVIPWSIVDVPDNLLIRNFRDTHFNCRDNPGAYRDPGGFFFTMTDCEVKGGEIHWKTPGFKPFAMFSIGTDCEVKGDEKLKM